MAKLPQPFDARSHWIRDLLHHGRREEALALLRASVEAGTAGEDTKALAAYLESAGRGHPPFGAKHLWFEIGTDNDEWRSEGKTHAERMALLAKKYRIYDETKLKTYCAKYERAIEELRNIDRGER